MADKEKFMIKIEGNLIEVSPDVYYAYFRMERQERGQEEKKQRNAVVSYDALDNGETVGLESMADMVNPGMEELAIAKEMKERLHHAVVTRSKAERELIQAIYFDGLTEQQYAKASGLSQQGVGYRLGKFCRS